MKKNTIAKYLLFSDLFLIVWDKCKFYFIVWIRWSILLFSINKNITPISLFICHKKLFSGQHAELNFEFENILYFVIEINNGKHLFFTKHDLSDTEPDFVVVQNINELEGNTWHLIGSKFKTVETSFTFLNKLSNNDSLKLTAVGFGKNILVQEFKFISLVELSKSPSHLNLKQDEIVSISKSSRELKISTQFINCINLGDNSPKFNKALIELSRNITPKYKFNRFKKSDYL